jgi:EAL and modified HD-GYP domain-containing signal transduction protein
VLFARQPILDRDRKVSAYQLHFRSVVMPDRDAPDTTVQSAFEQRGLSALTRGRPAFLRMPASRLGPELTGVFPPGKAVVEIPCEHLTVEDIIDEATALRQAGYPVALDDFRLTRETTPLVSFADYVKMNFLPASSQERQACVTAAREAKTALVAKRVEGQEIFEEASREGFTHFQGYFFERPGPRRGRGVPPAALVQLKLLHALSDQNRSLGQIEDLVKRDAALSYRILRLVNSAGFAQAMHVASMRQALLLVGRDTVCRWASLAVIAGLGAASPDEVVVMATVRARFCEVLGNNLGGPDAAGQGFLAGLCSLLDVMLNRPMADVLDELPVDDDVREALVGRDNHVRRLLECVMAYERGDWDACLDLAGLLGIARRSLTPAYLAALEWADEIAEVASGS